MDETCPYCDWPQHLSLGCLQGKPADEIESLYGIARRIRVPANVHSDDRTFSTDFDAAPWFIQASDDAIMALHGIGWGGDYESDAVAEHFEGHNKGIADVFVYCSNTQGTARACGFECDVDGDAAMAWLRRHRAGLWARLMCEEYGVRLVEAHEEEIKGMWDWLDDTGNACACSLGSIEEAALDAVNVLGLAG